MLRDALLSNTQGWISIIIAIVLLSLTYLTLFYGTRAMLKDPGIINPLCQHYQHQDDRNPYLSMSEGETKELEDSEVMLECHLYQ